jgi:hypothetical protein
MTITAMVLSIFAGTGSLVAGYIQAGYGSSARLIFVFGVVWLFAHWKRWHRFSAAALLVFVFAAGFGVWKGFASVWMLLGALGGLLGWDLSDFAMRLRYAAPTDDVEDMERRHLARVGMVALIGGGLAFLSMVVHIKRLAFEVAVGLILLAALGVTRLVMRLRK